MFCPGSQPFRGGSYNVPDVLGGVAEFATRNTGTQAEIADADGVILEGIGEVIVTFGHGADEHAHTLFRAEVCDVVFYSDNIGVVTQRNFPAIRGKMVGDGVLDHFQEFLLRVG